MESLCSEYAEPRDKEVSGLKFFVIYGTHNEGFPSGISIIAKGEGILEVMALHTPAFSPLRPWK